MKKRKEVTGKVGSNAWSPKKKKGSSAETMQTMSDEDKVFQTEMPLHPDMKRELVEIRKRRAFEPMQWIQEKAVLLNEYMGRFGLKACCVNTSGGIDSSVTVALCYYASKLEGSPIQKIVGVQQPIHSTAAIQDRALHLSGMCDLIKIDQSPVFDLLAPICEKTLDIDEDKINLRFQRGMLKSYMRTPVVYYVAQLLGAQGYGCLVVGTGNFDEDGYLYYFCKAGDGIADIQLINELHKSEVYNVGLALGLHDSILKSAPSADLWDGQTDENELGLSYDFVELYTEYINLKPNEREELRKRLSEESLKDFLEMEKKIKRVHNRNKHKENYPYNINVERFELKKAVDMKE